MCTLKTGTFKGYQIILDRLILLKNAEIVLKVINDLFVADTNNSSLI